ncbi:MAG: hypothetical protein AB8B56_02660 [Crocinitomicaceae bacterium]
MLCRNWKSHLRKLD